MALVGKVELVVGEEERDSAHTSLTSGLHRLLDLVEHRGEFTARVASPEIRGRAVDALHGAAHPRAHRERVRRGIERIADRRTTEAEVVGSDSLCFSPPDDPRGRLERLSPADRGKRILACAHDAVLDVEVLEALLRGKPRTRPPGQDQERPAPPRSALAATRGSRAAGS